MLLSAWFWCWPLAGQSAANPTASPPADSVSDHYRQQDIATATVSELVSQCLRLGLASTGAVAELRQRLLAYYHLDVASPLPAATPDAAPVPNPSPATASSAQEKKPLEVTIETAGSASYFTVQEVDEQYLRLSGGVVLLVNDPAKNAKHRVKADNIMYNRQKDTMIAQGHVEYTQTENGKDQNFKGSEMHFSMATMEVFLLDGVLHNQHAVSGKALDFEIDGREISRNDRNLVVLNETKLSSSQSSPPAYQVGAGHIWLLQSGEWAVRDGVLYVGRVPLFYIPFFYYPSDEMVIHPVAGYQDPEGAFLQTTTYLIGKKPKSQAPLSFMQMDETSSAATDYRLQGLYLEPVSTRSDARGKAGEAKSATNTSDYLKLLIDVYSRYGYFSGIVGKFALPPTVSLDFTAAFGFSRSLYTGVNGLSTYYFDAAGNESEYWDSGYLLGGAIPFRFLLNLQTSIKLDSFQWGITVPLASDPTFRNDFLASRKEDLDWAKLLGLNKSSSSTTSVTSTTSTADTMNMIATLSWNPSVPFLKPLVESFSVSNLDASLNWNSKTWASAGPAVATATKSANKLFWTPELLTFPKFSASVSGTIFQYPFPASVAAPQTSPTPGVSPGPEFLLPGAEIPSLPAPSPSPLPSSVPSPGPKDTDLGDFQAAATIGAVDAQLKASDWQARLGYTLAPGLIINSRFGAADAVSPLNLPSYLSYWTLQDRLSAAIKLNLSSPLNLFSLDSSVNMAVQDQQLLAMDLQAPVSLLASIRQETVKARYQTFDNTDILKLNPFQGLPWVGASNFEYGISMLWYQKKWLSGTSEDTAVYKTDSFEWTKDFITRHYSGLNLSFVASPFSAHLSGQFVLPPLLNSINTHADVQWERLSLSADESFNQKTAAADLTPAPVRLALGLPLFDWFSSNHSLEIDVGTMKVNSYTGT